MVPLWHLEVISVCPLALFPGSPVPGAHNPGYSLVMGSCLCANKKSYCKQRLGGGLGTGYVSWIVSSLGFPSSWILSSWVFCGVITFKTGRCDVTHHSGTISRATSFQAFSEAARQNLWQKSGYKASNTHPIYIQTQLTQLTTRPTALAILVPKLAL